MSNLFFRQIRFEFLFHEATNVPVYGTYCGVYKLVCYLSKHRLYNTMLRIYVLSILTIKTERARARLCLLIVKTLINVTFIYCCIYAINNMADRLAMPKTKLIISAFRRLYLYVHSFVLDSIHSSV